MNPNSRSKIAEMVGSGVLNVQHFSGVIDILGEPRIVWVHPQKDTHRAGFLFMVEDLLMGEVETLLDAMRKLPRPADADEPAVATDVDTKGEASTEVEPAPVVPSACTQEPVRSVIPEVVPPPPPAPAPAPRTVEVKATPAAVEALAPVTQKAPAAAAPAKPPAGDIRQEFDLEKLRACKSLRAIVDLLKAWGWTTQEAVTVKCTELRDSGQVPYLTRVATLSDRIAMLFT